MSFGPECERDSVRREGKYTKLNITYLCSRACFFIANTRSYMVNIPHSSCDASLSQELSSVACFTPGATKAQPAWQVLW